MSTFSTNINVLKQELQGQKKIGRNNLENKRLSINNWFNESTGFTVTSTLI